MLSIQCVPALFSTFSQLNIVVSFVPGRVFARFPRRELFTPVRIYAAPAGAMETTKVMLSLVGAPERKLFIVQNVFTLLSIIGWYAR